MDEYLNTPWLGSSLAVCAHLRVIFHTMLSIYHVS